MFNAVHTLLVIVLAGNILATAGVLLAYKAPVLRRVAYVVLAGGAVQTVLAVWAIFFITA